MEVMRMLSVAGGQITMHGILIVCNLLCVQMYIHGTGAFLM